jgi:hypothetical protein
MTNGYQMAFPFLFLGKKVPETLAKLSVIVSQLEALEVFVDLVSIDISSKMKSACSFPQQGNIFSCRSFEWNPF